MKSAPPCNKALLNAAREFVRVALDEDFHTPKTKQLRHKKEQALILQALATLPTFKEKAMQELKQQMNKINRAAYDAARK